MDGQPLHCVTHSAERQTGSLGELARTLLSFKRHTLAIELQQFRILAFSLGVGLRQMLILPEF